VRRIQISLLCSARGCSQQCYKHITDGVCFVLQKEVSEANSFVFDWQNLAPGVALLLAEATNWQPPSFTVCCQLCSRTQ
jgi:hypothetical protein